LLKQMGYEADLAANGREVLQALERERYDVIFMDLQMPEMDGLQATAEIRRRQKGSKGSPHYQGPITIIAMTASALQGDRERCFEAGMDDYISKPVHSEVLAATIERFAPRHCRVGEPSGAEAPAEPSAPSEPPTARVVELQAAERQPEVDLERLRDFSGGNEEELQDLIQLYLRQTTEQLNQIGTALEAGCADKVKSVAHACAGASFTCGLPRLAGLLKEIEHAAKAGRLEGVPVLLKSVQAEFRRVQQFFSEPTNYSQAA